MLVPVHWAGIVRVSYVGTRTGETFHADQDQVATIEHYARQRRRHRRRSCHPSCPSAADKPINERPSLRAAIEGVEAGMYDGIVVAYLSRLTRSRSGGTIWERVEAAGGTIHCAQENLDTSTANGRWIRDMHLANAVREREEHAERHEERRRKTIEAGVWKQRQVPLGYEFVGPPDDTGRYRGRARLLRPER
jgi:DNA invertase Pin-like site-specific DNA recombinase